MDIKITRDPKTEEYFFTQGKIKFKISNLLEETIGAGRFLGEGPLDKLDERIFKQLAEQNGLPIEPFLRELLRRPLMRLLQREWYISFEGQVPPAVINNDQKRMEEFWKEWAIAKTANVARVEKIKSSPNAGRGQFKSGPPPHYTPTKNIGKDLKGQQGLVAGWFKKNPKGGTCEQITSDLVAGGFTCNQDPIRAIYYYLNEWKKKGWLEAK